MHSVPSPTITAPTNVPDVPTLNAGAIERPALFGLLEHAARITQVSAPAGSGKSVLLRSWIHRQGLQQRAAWVNVERNEHDAQAFWKSLIEGLRATTLGAALVRSLEPTPSFDGWHIVERLLEDLVGLEERLWIVIDDLHELRSEDAMHQIELLLLRAPAPLRFALLTRRDAPLGLHRLRVEGEFTEIRGADLRFSAAEARVLLESSGVQVSESALRLLVDRTEGWAAGLRLAALSMARHPDPERFATEFAGNERTVAQYLLAEVLDRQPQEVRRLLLRTSVLERINGPLADALTGASNGERLLQDLEDANVFVSSIDQGRSWFRYHHLFADLLRLELRRTAAADIPLLHAAAARWYAATGDLIAAIRHAQDAGDWRQATHWLSQHCLALQLDGKGATAHELLARFPLSVVSADAELATVRAAAELDLGSLDHAEHYLALANRESRSVPPERAAHFQVVLAVARIRLARKRSDLAAIADAQKLLSTAEADAQSPTTGEELRALALISLGAAEIGCTHPEAERHLAQGVSLAQRVARPYLQIYGLGHWAGSALHFQQHTLAIERAMRAIELAKLHGWTEEPVMVSAYLALGVLRHWQGQGQEAEHWLGQAARALRPELDPGAAEAFYLLRAEVELVRGRYRESMEALRAAERATRVLAGDRPLGMLSQFVLLLTQLKMGETKAVAQALTRWKQVGAGQLRLPLAALRLAEGDALSASQALEPVLDGTAPVFHKTYLVLAFVLEAIARHALGDEAASARGLESALELAEPDGLVSAFLLYPVPELLERRRKQRTAHASLISEILDRLTQKADRPARVQDPELREPLSKSELRLLRYLPTHLSTPEIASELHVSVNTVKTHMRNLYSKLSVHGRSAALKKARALALLAPSVAISS